MFLEQVLTGKLRLSWQASNDPHKLTYLYQKTDPCRWFVYDKTSQTTGKLKCTIRRPTGPGLYQLWTEIKQALNSDAYKVMPQTETLIEFDVDASSPLYESMHRMGIFNHYTPLLNPANCPRSF